jgi:hypothetical protein
VTHDPYSFNEKMPIEELDAKIYNLLTKPEYKKKDPYLTTKALESANKILKQKILKEKPLEYFQATELEENSLFEHPLYHGNGNKTAHIVHEDFFLKLNPNYDSFNVSERECPDKTTLMHWLRYKCSMYGFHPVITASRKLTTGHLVQAVFCEYRVKPLRDKFGQLKNGP